MARPRTPRPAGTVHLTGKEVEYIVHATGPDQPKRFTISVRMGITEKTVETHRANAYRKLSVNGVVQLVYRAVELKLIPCPCCRVVDMGRSAVSCSCGIVIPGQARDDNGMSPE